MDMSKAQRLLTGLDNGTHPLSTEFVVPDTVRLFHKRGVATMTVDEMLEGMSAEQVYAKLASDLNFLSRFLLGDLFKYDWPPTIIATWALMIQSVAALQDYAGEANLAIGIPRGFAKSTLMKIFCCYCLLFTRHTFIMVVGNIDANAANIIKDIDSMLDGDHVRKFFGSHRAQMPIDRQDFKLFRFQGKVCILRAKGGRTSLRGLNVEHRRPDVILMDDIQDDDNAKSDVESKALLSWIVNTLLPTRSTDGAINLYVGNTYDHDGSILKKLVEDPEWVSLTLGAILEDGTSLWPELHPLNKLISSYKSALKLGEERSWLAQYMNAMDTEASDDFDSAAIRRHWDAATWIGLGVETGADAEARYIIIDPASTKKTADEHSVAAFYVYNGIPVCRKIVNGQMNPKQAISTAVALALVTGCFDIFIEDVGYQDTLIFWFKELIRTDDTMFPPGLKDLIVLRPCAPGRGSKNTRILHTFSLLKEGSLLVHPDAFAQVKNEGVAFDKLRTNNVDNVLDTLHYAYPVYVANKHLLADNAMAVDIYNSKRDHELSLSAAYNLPL